MKDRIVVDFNALDRIVKKLNRAGSDLESAASMLSGVRPTNAGGANLRLNGAGMSLKSVGGTVSAVNVAQAVESYRGAIKRVSSHSRNLASAVKSTSSAFQKAEKSNAGSGKFALPAAATGSVAAAKAVSSSTSEVSSRGCAFKWTTKDTLKVFEKGGIIGSGIYAAGTLINDIRTGGVTAKTVLSMLKGGAGIVEKTAKGFSKNSFDWLGLNTSVVDTGRKSFGEAMGDAVNKYSFGKATKVSDKVAVGAKWAGTVLTVATTGYDNFVNDTEGNSTGRKIAETIGESAVKIGGGIVIGSIATAALSVVGAPAIVTGVVTVAATWAIDKAFEAVTGKGAAEFISDTVLDSASKLATKVGSAAKKAGNAISGWWNTVTRGPQLSGGGGSW